MDTDDNLITERNFTICPVANLLVNRRNHSAICNPFDTNYIYHVSHNMTIDYLSPWKIEGKQFFESWLRRTLYAPTHTMAPVLNWETDRPSMIICEAAGHSGSLRLLSVTTAKVIIYNLQQCFHYDLMLNFRNVDFISGFVKCRWFTIAKVNFPPVIS